MEAVTTKISQGRASVRVRIGGAVLTMSGTARELFDIDTVASEIRGLDRENAICALIGLGFRPCETSCGGTRGWVAGGEQVQPASGDVDATVDSTDFDGDAYSHS